MTSLHAWATRWQIPPHILADLLAVMGAGVPDAPDAPEGQTAGQFGQWPGASEASVQNAVRMAAAKRYSARMFRNNSGVAVREDGVPVRYGLCNESAQINRIMKSSDLIGITPVVCPCGQRYGVFSAYECKRPGWKFRQSDERAVAQLAFIRLVVSMGGIAKFVTGESEI